MRVIGEVRRAASRPAVDQAVEPILPRPGWHVDILTSPVLRLGALRLHEMAHDGQDYAGDAGENEVAPDARAAEHEVAEKEKPDPDQHELTGILGTWVWDAEAERAPAPRARRQLVDAALAERLL